MKCKVFFVSPRNSSFTISVSIVLLRVFFFIGTTSKYFIFSNFPTMTQHKFIYDLRNESNPIDCFKVIFWYSIWYFGRKLIKAFCCQFIHSNAKLREKRSKSRLDHTHAKPKKGKQWNFIYTFFLSKSNIFSACLHNTVHIAATPTFCLIIEVIRVQIILCA